jgi:hypothetical protein
MWNFGDYTRLKSTIYTGTFFCHNHQIWEAMTGWEYLGRIKGNIQSYDEEIS